jgi:hypothetical protein
MEGSDETHADLRGTKKQEVALVKTTTSNMLPMCLTWREWVVRLLKDRLGDQRGRGEWMRADKNSSQRMNPAYASNSQPRIPTRVCQGRVVTTDLPTLGTNPNSKQHRSATQKAKDLDNLHSLGRNVCVEGRTVCGDRADRPQAQGGPSEKATRTSSTAPRITDCPRPTRGPSARTRPSSLTSRTIRQTSSNQMYQTKRIKTCTRKNTRRTRHQICLLLADCPCALGELSTRHENTSPNSKMRGQPLLSIHGSPKRLELLRKDLGEMWSVPRRCYTPKLESSNELNCWESVTPRVFAQW